MHFVLVDEASWFMSRTVSELFDQARKFGIGVILAVQRLGQLVPEDVRDAVLANSGTIISFRLSDRDEAASA
jgi:DNA helicase HerA-like ATPase